MSNFEKFKEAFNAEFGRNIYDFIDKYEGSTEGIPFGGKLIENLDETDYNSYGDEYSALERIYYFEDFNIYISFEGTRSSYNGEEWDDFKEVKQSTKTIQFWSKVN